MIRDFLYWFSITAGLLIALFGFVIALVAITTWNGPAGLLFGILCVSAAFAGLMVLIERTA